jgi:PAS domain S-box-containing protein
MLEKGRSGDVGATILLACPAGDPCSALRPILEQHCHRVIEAASAEDSLQRLKHGGIDLVIVGAGFGRDGQLSLARRIKTAPSTAAVPVLAVVAREGPAEERSALLEDGVDGHVAHPFEAREVAASVNALLRLLRTRADLRASEERAQRRLAELDAVYDSAPVGLCVLDADLRYVRINQRMADMNGLPADKHIGRTVRDMVPHVADQAEPVLRRVLETGEPVLGIDIVGETAAHPGVQRIWVENWHPIRDVAGWVIGINVVAEEITERKRAETTLSFLANASRTLSELLDPGAIVTAIGRLAVPHLADWTLVETFGTNLSPDHLVLVHADAARAAEARAAALRYAPERNPAHPLARVIATGRAELLADVPDALLAHVARDAAHLEWLRSLNLGSAIVVPMVARGRAVGILGLATAESGRRYDAHDLALAEELGRRAALAVDNARLYSELREEARRKDQFLATLAHELRNPLASILSAVAVLDRDSPQTAHAINLRAIIARQTRHLARLVDDLLDVARLTSGKVALQRRSVDVRDAVRHSVDGLRQAGRGLEHEVTMSLPGDPVLVNADSLRLEQVIGNLLDNAVKYTPPGRAIRVAVTREAEAGVVRVQDEGAGIAPALLARIFEPFVQAEHPGARPQGGLGLGLALARGLVEQHGGALSAHSAGEGHGSEFTVRLPLAAAGDARDEPRGPRPLRRALSILLIEDNDDARTALRALLESDGHHVDIAADGEHGLEVAAASKPEVVIVDIGLPVIDGYEVARRLRASRSSARLIALTGYGQPEDRRRSQDAGFDAHLVKPVDDAQLARVLEATA